MNPGERPHASQHPTHTPPPQLENVLGSQAVRAASLAENEGVGIHGSQHSPEVAPGDLWHPLPLAADPEGSLTGLTPLGKLASSTDNDPAPGRPTYKVPVKRKSASAPQARPSIPVGVALEAVPG